MRLSAFRYKLSPKNIVLSRLPAPGSSKMRTSRQSAQLNATTVDIVLGQDNQAKTTTEWVLTVHPRWLY